MGGAGSESSYPNGLPGPITVANSNCGIHTGASTPVPKRRELGYAYNPVTGTYIEFFTHLIAAVLRYWISLPTTRLITPATYSLPYPLRAGPVNINTRNSAVIAALLKGALPNEPPTTAGVPSSTAMPRLRLIAAATSTQPAMNRQDLSRLAAAVGTTIGSTEEQKETVVRAS